LRLVAEPPAGLLEVAEPGGFPPRCAPPVRDFIAALTWPTFPSRTWPWRPGWYTLLVDPAGRRRPQGRHLTGVSRGDPAA